MKFDYTKRDEDFSNLLWITGLKKDKTEHRNHIKRIMVKDGKVVSTDGAEMREITLINTIPDGYYALLKRTKSEVSIFNEVSLEDESFPEYAEIMAVNGNVKLSLNVNSYGIDKGLCAVIRAMTEHSFNPIKYLEIFNGMDFQDVWVDPEGCRPAYFEATNVRAVLMPIRG